MEPVDAGRCADTDLADMRLAEGTAGRAVHPGIVVRIGWRGVSVVSKHCARCGSNLPLLLVLIVRHGRLALAVLKAALRGRSVRLLVLLLVVAWLWLWWVLLLLLLRVAWLWVVLLVLLVGWWVALSGCWRAVLLGRVLIVLLAVLVVGIRHCGECGGGELVFVG